MEDNKLWLRIWSLITVFVVVLTISIAGYHSHKNNVRAQMVKDGINPLMVNCVIEDEYNLSAKCMVLAAKD